MDCKDYIQKMISLNGLIYIDTAALMDTERMRRFTVKCADTLRLYGNRIIVTKAVCLELARHLGSKNINKRERAIKVFDIFTQNRDIFEICNGTLSEEEIAKAFADSELLAELTQNKTRCGQLLITNDKKLSKDAYALNSQESCRGHKIMVCYIDREGMLHASECVKTSKDVSEQGTDCEPDNNEGSADEQRMAETWKGNSSGISADQGLCAKDDGKEIRTSSIVSSGWKVLGASVFSFGAGVLFEKHKSSIFRFVSSLF